MDWSIYRAAFHVDGSLRDIYVHEITHADWEAFLDFARRYQPSFFLEGVLVQAPNNVAEIFAMREDHPILMQLESHGVTVNCHFFAPDELELDIDPREITSQDKFDVVADIMVGIGNLLDKRVTLTEENSPDQVWLLYDPGHGEFTFSTPSDLPDSLKRRD